MPIPPRQKTRLVLALLLVGATIAASACLLTSRSAVASDATLSSVLVSESDGFRYEYHVPTGRESLFDLRDDSRHLVNVLSQKKDVAAKCRKTLEEKLQVPNLESLRSRYDAEIRRLHALGYL